MKPQDAINRVSEHADIVEWESGGARFRARRPDDVNHGEVVHQFKIDRDTGNGWEVNGNMDPLVLRHQLLQTQTFELVRTARW